MLPPAASDSAIIGWLLEDGGDGDAAKTRVAYTMEDFIEPQKRRARVRIEVKAARNLMKPHACHV
jgi:hypothetical protein